MWNRLFGFMMGILTVVGVWAIYIAGILTGKSIYKKETKKVSYRRYKLDK